MTSTSVFESQTSSLTDSLTTRVVTLNGGVQGSPTTGGLGGFSMSTTIIVPQSGAGNRIVRRRYRAAEIPLAVSLTLAILYLI